MKTTEAQRRQAIWPIAHAHMWHGQGPGAPAAFHPSSMQTSPYPVRRLDSGSSSTSDAPLAAAATGCFRLSAGTTPHQHRTSRTYNSPALTQAGGRGKLSPRDKCVKPWITAVLTSNHPVAGGDSIILSEQGTYCPWKPDMALGAGAGVKSSGPVYRRCCRDLAWLRGFTVCKDDGIPSRASLPQTVFLHLRHEFSTPKGTHDIEKWDTPSLKGDGQQVKQTMHCLRNTVHLAKTVFLRTHKAKGQTAPPLGGSDLCSVMEMRLIGISERGQQ